MRSAAASQTTCAAVYSLLRLTTLRSWVRGCISCTDCSACVMVFLAAVCISIDCAMLSQALCRWHGAAQPRRAWAC